MEGDLMELNVKEFVDKEIELKACDGLIPIYEALSNSIHVNSKKIEVILIRELQKKIDKENKKKEKIVSVTIKDDGEGFGDENFKSFNMAFESNKQTGKGKGRFFFLKGFREVRITSNYKEKDVRYSRNFSFEMVSQGVTNLVENSSGSEEKTGTKLELIGLKSTYKIPLDLEKIAWSIISHFLLEFTSNSSFDITLVDEDEILNLREIFKEQIKDEIKNIDFNIKDYNFKLNYSLISKNNGIDSSKLILTANNRSVIEENLSKYSFFDSAFEENYVFSYISSEYLDETVDSNRYGFQINDQLSFTKPKITEVIEIDEIIKNSLEILKSELKESIKETMKKREERMDNYFNETIYSADKIIFDIYKDEIIEKIKENSRNSTIEKIFDEKKRALKKETESELKKIDIKDENFKEKIKLIKDKVDVAMHSALADYVVQRKVIIDLYYDLLEGETAYKEKKTGISKTYKFSLEEEIHNLIFPMKRDSLEVTYEDHNLWLIDDVLAFQSYITSDLELEKFTKYEDNKDRPDLVFFSDYNSKDVMDSITIIELKRAEFNPNTRTESPTDQVKRYVNALRKEELSLRGKTLKVSDSTRFYCYILVDLNKYTEELFKLEDFIALREKRGYFYYHKTLNAYINVLDYNLLGRDAERRNLAFFDKLGIRNIK